MGPTGRGCSIHFKSLFLYGSYATMPSQSEPSWIRKVYPLCGLEEKLWTICSLSPGKGSMVWD